MLGVAAAVVIVFIDFRYKFSGMKRLLSYRALALLDSGRKHRIVIAPHGSCHCRKGSNSFFLFGSFSFRCINSSARQSCVILSRMRSNHMKSNRVRAYDLPTFSILHFGWTELQACHKCVGHQFSSIRQIDCWRSSLFRMGIQASATPLTHPARERHTQYV